ncbi:MAG: hypothetical protein ACLFU3_06670, partial [Dichotomicrobium sp.]
MIEKRSRRTDSTSTRNTILAVGLFRLTRCHALEFTYNVISNDKVCVMRKFVFAMMIAVVV